MKIIYVFLVDGAEEADNTDWSLRNQFHLRHLREIAMSIKIN